METTETIDSDAASRTMIQAEHPQASSIQTLGILGLVFTFLLGIVGLILNIVCLAKSGPALSDVRTHHGQYTEESVRKIRSGRTCAIIGLSLQAFAILLIVVIAIAGGM
jgi:uncharacterized membrane protein YbaN (DUF454 family)